MDKLKNKNTIVLIISAVLILIAIIVLLLFFFYRYSKKQAKDEIMKIGTNTSSGVHPPCAP